MSEPVFAYLDDRTLDQYRVDPKVYIAELKQLPEFQNVEFVQVSAAAGGDYSRSGGILAMRGSTGEKEMNAAAEVFRRHQAK